MSMNAKDRHERKEREAELRARRERIAMAVLPNLAGLYGVNPSHSLVRGVVETAVQWANALIAELDKTAKSLPDPVLANVLAKLPALLQECDTLVIFPPAGEEFQWGGLLADFSLQRFRSAVSEVRAAMRPEQPRTVESDLREDR